LKFKKNGLFKLTTIISPDYTFVTQIERGYPLTAQLSIVALINKVFEISCSDYRNMLMFALPEIIKKDQVSIILPFFSRDQ